MSRIKPSQDIRIQLLYRSARTCCVCRTPKLPVQIHHIDKDNSNSIEPNLAVLCQNCHDEAHTKHDLSQNLTESDIRHYKELWECEVAQRSTQSMLPQSHNVSALWTYINHTRLHGFLNSTGLSYDSAKLKRLMALGIVDEFGIIQPLEAPSTWKATWTVYDYTPHHLVYPVHNLFTEAVDELVLRNNPIEIDGFWKRTELKSLLQPGVFIFSLRGFYFKDIDSDESLRFSNRLCYAQKNKIRIEFRVSTRNMFGDSSIYTTFSGHSIAAVLLIFKGFSESNGILVLHCTPVAMGSGFIRSTRESPHQEAINPGRFDTA